MVAHVIWSQGFDMSELCTMLVQVRSQRKTKIEGASCARRRSRISVGRGEAHLRRVVSYGTTSPRGEMDRFIVDGNIGLPPPVLVR